MSILVKDYTWTQTANTIHIRVPINPVYREKIDLFSADTYIKAHYSPFLFEIFLLHAVNNSTSKCTIKDDLILFDLAKRDELDWECLEKDLTKAEKMKIKQDVLEQCQVQAKQASEDKRIRKSQLDRYTVQEAMAIDDKQHKLMDSRRDEQRKKAMEALEEWRVSDPENYTVKHVKEENNRFENTGIKIVDLSSSDDEGKNENNKKDVLKNDLKEEIGMKQQKIRVSEPIKTPVKSEYIDKKKQEASKRILPKLRETTELVITHTPRSFPTPSRESMANEEETWLKNITLARRATGFVSEDLRPEEQDPQWCKEKGDEFFRMGNFLGAISAYTHGITLSDKLPSLYANRAATHFALGNFNKCVNDSSTALDLMKPACEGNRRSRAKCIARRAAALTRLGYLNKAIDEMKAALKLLPDDDTIKKDIYNMERAWEQNPDSD